MKKAEFPKDEIERVNKLESYNILDTLSEKEYDGIAKLASFITDSPISLISLIDKERQWFKSKVGLDVSETHRDYAFCAHAILEPNNIFQVPDASKDERFADNPLVTGSPNIRFYAGSPLVTSDNFSLGTLCVIDRVARKLTPKQEEGLTLLAAQVMSLFEERILSRKVKEQEQKIKSQFLELENSMELILKKSNEMTFQLKMAARIQKMILPLKAPFSNIQFAYKPLEEVGGDFFEFINIGKTDKLGIFISDVAGHGIPSALITALLKSALNQANLETKEDPASLLTFINEFIFDYIDNRFVTAFYGILDFNEKTMLFSNAGHPSPYIFTDANVYLEKQKGKSLPLGILDKSQLATQGKEYNNAIISFPTANRILFYTDGLLEQSKEKKDGTFTYFEDELENLLETIKMKPNLLELILSEFNQFSSGKEQMDDICLISVDFL